MKQGAIKMPNEGSCAKCGDTCIVINEVVKDGKKEMIASCVKNCSWIFNKPLCENCLQAFNSSQKRYKIGNIIA